MDTTATVVSSSIFTDQKAARKRVKMRLTGPDLDPFDVVVDGDVAPRVGSKVTLSLAVEALEEPEPDRLPGQRLGVRNDQAAGRTEQEAILLHEQQIAESDAREREAREQAVREQRDRAATPDTCAVCGLPQAHERHQGDVAGDADDAHAFVQVEPTVPVGERVVDRVTGERLGAARGDRDFDPTRPFAPGDPRERSGLTPAERAERDRLAEPGAESREGRDTRALAEEQRMGTRATPSGPVAPVGTVGGHTSRSDRGDRR